jgi:predicted PurR-regulated permease PerM
MNALWARNLFWACLVVALVYGVHLLSNIILPFVAGAGIAFVLSPLVDRLERYRISRSIGTLISLIGFLLLIVMVVLLVVPILQQQLGQLMTRVPDYITGARSEFDRLLNLASHRLSKTDMQSLHDAVGAKLGDVAGEVGRLLGSVLTGGVAVANVLSLVFITPIVAFFMLRDWTQLLLTIDSWLPRQHRETIRKQASLIEDTLSGFLRGQASVCLAMGFFYAAGLSLIGLDAGLILGLLIGLLIFIPFLGGLTGAVVAVLLGFAQFGTWHEPAMIALLFLIGQTIESNVLTPKLVGDRVHLHPVWIIFALLAAGDLLGILGVLIAVPVAAIIGVLGRFAVQQYLDSPLYDPQKPTYILPPK